MEITIHQLNMKKTCSGIVLLSLLGLILAQILKEGVPNSIEKLPYMVFIEAFSDGEWSFVCGGSLISQNHVLTAAVCVDVFDPTKLRVIAGTTFLNKKQLAVQVENSFFPTNYNESTLDNDIALLKLKSKVPLKSTIKPIALCSQDISEGTILEVSGWGKPNDRPESMLSNQVHSIIGHVMKQSDCIKAYSADKNAPITSSMFCMNYAKGYTTCTGDGGAPAVHKNQLCGVFSWQKNCDGSYPSVFVNIYKQLSFIKAAMTA